MKNDNEIWDVIGDSRRYYHGPWAGKGRTERVNIQVKQTDQNQSDCRIRYSDLFKKIIILSCSQYGKLYLFIQILLWDFRLWIGSTIHLWNL